MCMNNVVIVAVEIHQNLKWLKKNQDERMIKIEMASNIGLVVFRY